MIHPDTKDVIRPSFLAFIHKFGNAKELKCVEVGVFTGKNARAMLEFAPNIHLYLVDPYITWGEARTEEVVSIIQDYARMQVEPYKDRVTWIRKESAEAFKDFEDGSLDYVYIDGDHTYTAVRKDIAMWFPKIKPYGIMGGHDWLAVKQAVYDHFDKSNLQIYSVECNINNPEYPMSLYGILQDWWVHKEIHQYYEPKEDK